MGSIGGAHAVGDDDVTVAGERQRTGGDVHRIAEHRVRTTFRMPEQGGEDPAPLSTGGEWHRASVDDLAEREQQPILVVVDRPRSTGGQQHLDGVGTDVDVDPVDAQIIDHIGQCLDHDLQHPMCGASTATRHDVVQPAQPDEPDRRGPMVAGCIRCVQHLAHRWAEHTPRHLVGHRRRQRGLHVCDCGRFVRRRPTGLADTTERHALRGHRAVTARGDLLRNGWAQEDLARLRVGLEHRGRRHGRPAHEQAATGVTGEHRCESAGVHANAHLQPRATRSSRWKCSQPWSHRRRRVDGTGDVVGTVEPHQCRIPSESKHVTTQRATGPEQRVECTREHRVEHLDPLGTPIGEHLGEAGETGQVGEDHRAVELSPRIGGAVDDPLLDEPAGVTDGGHLGRILEPPVMPRSHDPPVRSTANVPASSRRAQTSVPKDNLSSAGGGNQDDAVTPAPTH